MTENAEVILQKVRAGVPIRKAAKDVLGHPVYYYRNFTDLEKKTILRARREYQISQQQKESSIIVRKWVSMPLSRRTKLQLACDERNEPVNDVVNRLINLYLKNPAVLD